MMVDAEKNRYYYLIQVLIGSLGAQLSTQHWMVRKLADYRRFPDSLLEEDYEASLNQIIEEACGVLHITREDLYQEADKFRRSLENIRSKKEELERRLFDGGEEENRDEEEK